MLKHHPPVNEAPLSATLTVDMPGAMSTWWSGTGVIAGERYSDSPAEQAGAEEIARAWRERQVIRRGKGHSLRLTVSDPHALGVLADYAETLISINEGGDMDHSEVRAARTLIERIEAELARNGWRLVRLHWNTRIEPIEEVV